MDGDNSNKSKVSFLSVLQSTLAAAIGVQSEKNRQRDFTHGKPVYFIIAGLIFIVVFIAVIITIVQLVLPDTMQG
ncbi:MAG: DUF2970 domain-containing protein [Gammaproteobacteria bacterium]